MKTKLLLITIFFLSIAEAQTVLIPNGGFDTNTSGWSVTGTDVSINNSGGFLSINVSGIYTRNFVLTSSQFYLDATKTYKFYTDYRNVGYDQMTFEELPLGGFTNIHLKDSNNNTVSVAGFGLSSCNTGGYFDTCYSGDFSVATSGVYYVEFEGYKGPSDDFFVDNVGFNNVIRNTFSGTVALDDNNDGCATSTNTVANYPVEVLETNSNTSYNSFTDANGDFSIETDNQSGNFVTQTNYPIYTSTPANYTNVVTSGVNNYANQNFCLTTSIVANDVSINIIPTTQARPGFNTSYQIQYTNLGSTTLSGALNLSFDNSKVSFLNATTTPDSQTATDLSWNYVTLNPLESRVVDVNFNIFTPPTVNNGDVLNYVASITPVSGDYTPSNNTFTFNQITIGSYDPNDITILEGPLISSSQASDYLNVMIRFQNTGTASAINIRVENTLDNFLDWSTFQPIAASDSYITSITNGNVVDFIFNGINLPDSTSDEPGSHGWIFYKIKPKNTFALGDVISDVAEIYFDYNLPIITNTATTQIDATLSKKSNVLSESLIEVFPNPVGNQLTISITKVATYKLINTNGQVLNKGSLKIGENTLKTSNLSTGLYFVKVKTAEGISTRKIIKH